MAHKSFYTALYRWYEREKRVLPWRETIDPYKIWLSEIILQQTRVAQGIEYYMRFVDRWPTLVDLADSEEDEVMLLWQGLGYYSRARNLHRAAQQMRDNGGVFPLTFEEVRSLPGVGDYTAGAIMSFAYDAPYPAADGNVYRVLSRLFDCDLPFDTTQGKKHFRQLACELLDREQPRLFNSAIMEFGALYCTPTGMDCSACPLQAFCQAHQHGTAELLPVRKPRPQLRDRYLSYTVYRDNEGHTLLHKRTANDIWKHLYEFPLNEDNGQSPDDNDGGNLAFTHVLSHQRLHITFREVHVTALPDIPDCFPIRWEQLQNYALSRATLRYLAHFAKKTTISC